MRLRERNLYDTSSTSVDQPSPEDSRHLTTRTADGTFNDLENPTMEDAKPAYQLMHALPVPWVEVSDISNAMVFLCSDEARYITGETLAVAAGSNAKNAG